MTFYRCLICGETYMGEHKPSNCPYCGSPGKYLMTADRWVDENRSLPQLSAISQANIARALQMEVNNYPFYLNAKEQADSVELQGIFQYLAKIEQEHAATLINIVGSATLPEPQPSETEAAADDRQNLATAHEREVAAAHFYAQASQEAVERRVKKVFAALAAVETDHMHLEEGLLNRD